MGDISRGFLILLVFLALGELLTRYTHIPVPGNVNGMWLLAVAMATRFVKIEWVASAADVLLSRMGLFFVPPGVGVMLYFDRIASNWMPIVGAMLGSLLLVLWGTAAIARLTTGLAAGEGR